MDERKRVQARLSAGESVYDLPPNDL